MRGNEGLLSYLDRAARRYGTRPSALLAVQNEWAALYLDFLATDHGRDVTRRDAKSAKAWPVYDLSG